MLQEPRCVNLLAIMGTYVGRGAQVYGAWGFAPSWVQGRALGQEATPTESENILAISRAKERQLCLLFIL